MAGKNVIHDLKMYFFSLRVQLRAAAMLRGAFITQIIGMVINNAALALAWIFFFVQFGTVNGWNGADFIGLLGVQMLIFGICMLLSEGLMFLPQYVDSGSFDAYLTKPNSVLGQVSSSSIDVTAFGDVLLGLGFIIWYAMHTQSGFGEVALFTLAIAIGASIFWCFALLLPNALAFYMYDSQRTSRYIGSLFIDAGLYPTGVLTGPLRTFLLSAFPALLIGIMPLDVLRGLNFQWLGIGAIVAVFWVTFSLWLFKRSIKRYESANLVGAR